MRKKLLAITLCVMVAVSCMPTMAFAGNPSGAHTADRTQKAIETVAPTCTTGGYATYPCAGHSVDRYNAQTVACDAIVTVTADALGHDVTGEYIPVDPAKLLEATTAEWTVNGEEAANAAAIKDAAVELDILVYDSETKTYSVDPLCCSVEVKACSRCDKLDLSEATKVLGHERVNGTATCKGTPWTCKVCGAEGVDPAETVDHVWTAQRVHKSDATCTAPETVDYQCTVCGAWKNDTDTYGNALGHNYVVEFPTASACRAYVKCANCGLYYKGGSRYYETVVSLLANVDRTESTSWTEKASEARMLDTTGYTAEGFTFKHSYKKVEGGVACGITEDPAGVSHYGVWSGYFCEGCGQLKPDTEVAILQKDDNGHKYDQTITAKAATCTETGLIGAQHCQYCGKWFVGADEATKEQIAANFVIPANNHDFVNGTEVVAKRVVATCTVKGVTVIKCANCTEEKTVVGDYDKTNHNWAATQTEVRPASCTLPAIWGFECKDCGEFNAGTAKFKGTALGHTEATEVVAPTCTTPGYTKHFCSVCGVKTADNSDAVAALGHDFENGEWVVVRPATYLEEGLKALQCSRCAARQDYDDIAIIKVAKLKTFAVKAGAEKINVSWKAYAPKVDGVKVTYTVAYKQAGKNWKYKTTKNVKAALKELKTGKKYYVKVRINVTEDGTRVRGEYTTAKVVKVK